MVYPSLARRENYSIPLECKLIVDRILQCWLDGEMDLVSCVECQAEVESNALYCPKCGSIFYKDKGPDFLKNFSSESGWQYKGRNWGWVSLMQFVVILIFLSSEVLKWLGVALFMTFIFTMYLWVGAKNFWRSGP